MDKQGVSQQRDCWICYNNENTTNLTIVSSEKVLKNCRTYLDNFINIESFENETPSVSCCNYCYESAVELITLEKQVEKLGNEISELSSLFLKNVRERRNNLNKKKNDTSNVLTSPTDKGVTVHTSSCHHSTVVSQKLIEQEEIMECGSKALPSNSQWETEVMDVVSKIGLEAGDSENIFDSEECGIEVKYSYDETVSKVVGYDNQPIKPLQEMSGKIAQDCQQTIKTSMADLLKCLKMPIIQLERLASCKSGQPKDIIDKRPSNINLEIMNLEKCSSFSLGNINPPNEDIFPPEIAVLPENQENMVLICDPPLNTSVITRQETFKCENDINENQPYKCSICGQGFFKLFDLEDHEKLHINVHQYSCSSCDKSFLDPSVLKLHENFHTTKRPFNFSFNSQSVRTNEQELFHSGDKPLQCSACSKSFKITRSLKRHLILHSQNRRFKCSFCPKAFNSSHYLKTHEMIHTGERPYKCSFCPKAFNSSHYLKRHEMIHTGEKPYKCSFCPKSFTTSSVLRNHEAVHTGDTQYKCSICSKPFTNLGLLKIHRRFHTGERPYKCSTCSKSFATVGHLKRHKIIHTGERPFKCSICEMTFQLKQQLKLHRENIHGNSTEEFILP